MRSLVLGLVVAGAAWAQTMTEFGAAAAAGTAGGAAGKKVSDGITTIFGKVDQQAKEAAKPDPAKQDPPKQEAAKPDTATAATIAPASPDSGTASKPAAKPVAKTATKPAAKPATKPATASEIDDPDSFTRPSPRLSNSVPDPPPPAGQRAAVTKPAPPPTPKPLPELPPILPPPPPPREVTVEDLKGITPGTIREDLLKLGPPASRLSMSDDGHLLEIYSYMTGDTTLGVVRLSDGAVSRVELR